MRIHELAAIGSYSCPTRVYSFFQAAVESIRKESVLGNFSVQACDHGVCAANLFHRRLSNYSDMIRLS